MDLLSNFILLLSVSSLLFSKAVLETSFDEQHDLTIRQVASHDDEDDSLNAEEQFERFKVKYGKTYTTQEEHDHRLRIFKANLGRAKQHQLLDPSAVHGVTQFSDLTHDEFYREYLGLKPFRLPADAQKAPILPTDNLPTEFDWRKLGAVTPVKFQGACGSCWSFSAIGALEGAHFLATGNLESLSAQQLIDCDRECDPEDRNACDEGCYGGLMNNAFEYILKAGGVEREKDYPYTAKFRSPCKFNESKIVASVSNFSVVSVDEDQIAANLIKNGPLAAGINADLMQTYVAGVSCPYICPRELNHGVLLVGYGSGFSPIRFEEMPYWILKNSWSQYWGEYGYYRICRGQNMCGVNTMVSTVVAAV